MTPAQRDRIAQLQTAYDETVRFGGNNAIKKHLERVTAMTPAEFDAYQVERAETAKAFEPSVRMMAVELSARMAGKRVRRSARR